MSTALNRITFEGLSYLCGKIRIFGIFISKYLISLYIYILYNRCWRNRRWWSHTPAYPATPAVIFNLWPRQHAGWQLHGGPDPPWGTRSCQHASGSATQRRWDVNVTQLWTLLSQIRTALLLMSMPHSDGPKTQDL